MQAQAIAKYLKVSPSKVRPVVDQVRGLPVNQALALLAASPRRGARLIEKVILSAAANLKNQGKVSDDAIVIREIMADQGPLIPPYKYKARARGMASRIRNRTCHIKVVVGENETAAPVQ
ncbi:MAG TPA: 50S ribosomal protein L22 [bacterium]|nr:50S ribosomal protein L22 [bacterium]HPJ73066.1 50S ribosomal protein L22 [bacterium]HPQ65969.1 50S ribosomal protein L22 [bacterium]